MKTTTIDSLSHEELTGQAATARTAFASLPAEERARLIAADQERTRETVRAIEAGENRAPKMPGDAFSLHRRMDRVLTEYRWLHNGGPATPDFYHTNEREALEDARRCAHALVSALELL